MKMTGLSLVNRHGVSLLMMLAAFGVGCQKSSAQGPESPLPDTADTTLGGDPELNAGLAWLVSDELEQASKANLYEIVIQSSTGAPAVRRAGDLPTAGKALRLDGLRPDAAAVITASLYEKALQPANKTHSCTTDKPVELKAGATASVEMSCLATVDPNGEPIKVFIKLAQLSVNLTEKDTAQILAARDFTQPTLFARMDSKGRRITLKQDERALTVHVGGDVTYVLENDPNAALPLVQLLSGQALALAATGGQSLQALSEPATLKLTEAPLLYVPKEGELAAVLPILLANNVGSLSVDGNLFEEPATSEITVVSYNVENFFDQSDEERNQSYGDYRITPNAAGQSSNWGNLVEVDGQTMNFSEVKAANIRRALVGIDPAGPAIVGLVEVESQGAMDMLLASVQDLGYTSALFSEWTSDMKPTAIGLGLLTKLPVLSSGVVKVATPNVPNAEASRPILRVTLDVQGHPLTVYVNHWKSKSGPESQRILYAEALEADIADLVAANPRADYIVMGDLNSEYNEKVVIEPAANDANGRTGVNDVLRAQGDELAVVRGQDPMLKFDLHYDLDKAARRTAWHEGFGWSALDHMIIGPGLYDQRGVTYIDGSFQPATALQPRLKFLFKADGTTNRWRQVRNGPATNHEVGGYSDHLPLVVRLRVPAVQSSSTIWLQTPGKPDAADTPVAPKP